MLPMTIPIRILDQLNQVAHTVVSSNRKIYGGFMAGIKSKRARRRVIACFLAEAVRFELTNGCPLPVFKTGAIDHSATPP